MKICQQLSGSIVICTVLNVALAFGLLALPNILAAQETDSHALPGMSFVDRLSPEEAGMAYDGLVGDLASGYAKSGLIDAGYINWTRFTTTPYFSSVHSALTVHIYTNDIGEAAYSAYGGEAMPVGTIVAKDAIGQTADDIVPAPMAFMEKMEPGFNPDTGDWRFAMIAPDGMVVGVTNGPNEGRIEFCVACHRAASAANDWLFFPPAGMRIAAP